MATVDGLSRTWHCLADLYVMPVGVLWSSDFWIKRDAAALRFLVVEEVTDNHSFTRFLCVRSI